MKCLRHIFVLAITSLCGFYTVRVFFGNVLTTSLRHLQYVQKSRQAMLLVGQEIALPFDFYPTATWRLPKGDTPFGYPRRKLGTNWVQIKLFLKNFLITTQIRVFKMQHQHSDRSF